MRRLIGGGDREQQHQDDADRDGDIGRLGHVAAGGGGHKLRQGGKNKRLGHRKRRPVAGKRVCGHAGRDRPKVPKRGEAVNDMPGNRVIGGGRLQASCWIRLCSSGKDDITIWRA